jgi:hypothetical protein
VLLPPHSFNGKTFFMATISKGILGGFSGAVGTVVGGSWRGISYIRSHSGARKRAGTQLQIQQQMKFACCVKFLQPLTGLLAIGFRDFAIGMSAFNSAIRYTINNAVTGNYPLYAIDYSLALVCRGDLPNTITPAATSATKGQVDFSWTNNNGTGKAAGTDKAILVVYYPGLRQCIYTTMGANRSAGSASLLVNAFGGLEVETYISFISADDKNIASSIYTGRVTVVAL